MSTSISLLHKLLSRLRAHARLKGWSDAEWARRSGVPKETLCRLRSRTSCDFATLEALASAVGSGLRVRGHGLRHSKDGLWPSAVDRTLEARLVDVAAAGSASLSDWRPLGPPFFLAGILVVLASASAFDREKCLALAETLHPGASEPRVFARWLADTPLPPSRFLPAALAQVRRAD